MLIDANVRNLEVGFVLKYNLGIPNSFQTTIFGKRYPSPLVLAPVGVQGLMHKDGELASARAASALNIPYTASTAASRSMEEIAEAIGDGPRFYQLYWCVIRTRFYLSDQCFRPPTNSNEITLSLLDRAKKNGFSALFVTLDTMTIGWRPLDLTKAVMPFIHGLSSQATIFQ